LTLNKVKMLHVIDLKIKTCEELISRSTAFEIVGYQAALKALKTEIENGDYNS